MAFVNFLDGTIIGKYGSIYGRRGLGGVSISACPFSKAPPSLDQSYCVRAFEVLCRISGRLSSRFWPFLGLKQGDMLKHNRVAHWLGPAVTSHHFDIGAIADIIGADTSIQLHNFDVNPNTNLAHVDCLLTDPPPGASGGAWYLMLCDIFGFRYADHLSKEGDAFLDIAGNYPHDRTYWALAFRSDRINGKMKVHGFDWAEYTAPAP